MHTSTNNVFRALRLIASANRPLGVSEVSRRLDMPASSTHRVLITLERAGYVRRSANAGFEIGARVETLILALLRTFALREASAPYLQQLATASGQTTSLCIPTGWYSLRLASIQGNFNTVRRAGHRPRPVLLHDDSCAWAILASFHEHEIHEFLTFVRRNVSAQIPSANRVCEKVGKHRNGWVIELRPKEAFYTLSFPLRDAQNGVVGAVAVEGFDDIPKKELTRRAVEWAQLVSQLESLIQANPVKFEHPFAHIPREDIVFPPLSFSD